MNQQAHFVEHEPCPKCHSRDNLGRWSDGHAYCFGCGYREDPERTLETMKNGNVSDAIPSLVKEERWTESIPKGPYGWLKKYGITEAEISLHGIVYLPEKESLAFGFDPATGGYLTRRYFGGNPKHPKYIHNGRKNFTIISDSNNPPFGRFNIIFCEDILSAIRIGRFVLASPVFGSSIGLDRFRQAHKLFKRSGIWLDSDMAGKAAVEAARAVSLGFDCAGYIVGPHPDPKDHSDSEIKLEIERLFSDG